MFEAIVSFTVLPLKLPWLNGIEKTNEYKKFHRYIKLIISKEKYYTPTSWNTGRPASAVTKPLTFPLEVIYFK